MGLGGTPESGCRPLPAAPQAEGVGLTVTGRLPAWLHGAYLRNGPGEYRSGAPGGMVHLFDGYSLLLKVQLDGAANAATVSHRRVLCRAAAPARV